jgi:NitT/TauT family transport system substrate-binding protein
MLFVQNRRRFLTDVAFAGAAGLAGGGVGLAGVGAFLGGSGQSFAAEPPPEITAIRLAKVSISCVAPQYVAEELLRGEGFTDIHYVELEGDIGKRGIPAMIGRGHVDISLTFAAPMLIPMDAGEPITALAGVHVGCFELFAHEGIRSIADLKGRSVGIPYSSSSPHTFIAIMTSYIGLDYIKDINWIITSPVQPKQLFIERKIDAFLGFPPETQELRERKIGHVIASSTQDHPWSQYFCCMIAGNTEFVRKYPAATKRVLRAIFKATDLCVSEPRRVTQLMVERGYAARSDFMLQMLNELPYGVWREYDPEDTLRFYGLRMQELGMIKSPPQKLIAEHTNWRFLNELRRELKV